LDAAEDAELPNAFVATTVNEYGDPFVKPVKVTGGNPVIVVKSGNKVTV
jgi:hypothetical protein